MCLYHLLYRYSQSNTVPLLPDQPEEWIVVCTNISNDQVEHMIFEWLLVFIPIKPIIKIILNPKEYTISFGASLSYVQFCDFTFGGIFPTLQWSYQPQIKLLRWTTWSVLDRPILLLAKFHRFLKSQTYCYGSSVYNAPKLRWSTQYSILLWSFLKSGSGGVRLITSIYQSSNYRSKYNQMPTPFKHTFRAWQHLESW